MVLKVGIKKFIKVGGSKERRIWEVGLIVLVNRLFFFVLGNLERFF